MYIVLMYSVQVSIVYSSQDFWYAQYYIHHAALYSNVLTLHVCIESIAETKNLFKTALISKPYNRLTITIKEHHNNFSYTIGRAALYVVIFVCAFCMSLLVTTACLTMSGIL